MCSYNSPLKRYLLAAVASAAFLFAGDDVRPVTILHLNDLHARLQPLDNGAGGFACVASVIRREREGCTTCLLLSGGDIVQGSPVSTIFRGLPVYEIANSFGFDAGTLGNHDFDYGFEQTQRFLATARYPIVSSNLVDATGSLMTEKPYFILNAGTVRLAVVGGITEDLRNLTTSPQRGPWQVAPLLETLRKYANEARGRADLVVVLAHVTEDEELKLLRSLPEVPVVITGHAHRGLPGAVSENGRVVARVKAYGEELGRLELKVNVSRKSLESWEWKRIPVDSRSIPPDASVAALVKHWEDKVSEVVDHPLAVANREFAKPDVRRLLERALRESTGVDFAFINAGAVRDIIPRGQVLVRHVWNIMPFDNRVVIGKFPGSRLPAAVTNGTPVDPARDYTLAVADFTAANQGAASQLGTTGLEFPEKRGLVRDVFIDWIRRQGVLD